VGRGIARIALVSSGVILAVVIAEIVLRLIPSSLAFETYFEDAARRRVDYAGAKAKGLVVEGQLPRGRATFAPGTRFHICYRGGTRTGFDARGCVEVRISQCGIRDEREAAYEKPKGEKRIVCLGDSFTFGWGVPENLTWPRRLEEELKKIGISYYRTINCGASGTLYVDEYYWGLRDRFFRFDPDAVLVTVCLNDLVPMPDTLGVHRKDIPPPEARGWRVLDLLAGRGRQATEDYLRRVRELERGKDWGQLLIDLPASAGGAELLRERGEEAEMFWGAGGPQQALQAMRDWCREKRVPFGVVVWPLMQGLGSRDQYPFETLHRVAVEWCKSQEIPVLDLLPAFLGWDPASLWVDPCDMHPNEVAQQIAAPVIAGFLERSVLVSYR
jgi:lysophospholipase L1-like esterase